MRVRLFFVVLALVATAFGYRMVSPPPVSVDDGQKRFVNIAYGELSPNQKLDLYLPASAAPHPLIVYLHGGGFKAGDKRAGNARPIISAALGNGYAVASINYRLSKEAKFPAAVEDVFAALEFLKAEAEQYDLSRDLVAIWGDSAGGNLASMAATREAPDGKKAVKAAINWFGPIQFDLMDDQFSTLGLDPMLGPTSAPASPESEYLGRIVGSPEAADLVIRASPQTYVTPDDVPMLIQHGTADRNVPVLQSENFARALAAAIGADKVEFDSLPGAGHGGEAFLSEDNFARIFTFLNKHLKRR